MQKWLPMEQNTSKKGFVMQFLLVFTLFFVEYLEVMQDYVCEEGACSIVPAGFLVCSIGLSLWYRQNYVVNSVCVAAITLVFSGLLGWDFHWRALLRGRHKTEYYDMH